MNASDTVTKTKKIRVDRKGLFPHRHKDCFECELFVKECQADATWPIAEKAGYDRGFTEGKKDGWDERDKWLSPDETERLEAAHIDCESPVPEFWQYIDLPERNHEHGGY